MVANKISAAVLGAVVLAGGLGLASASPADAATTWVKLSCNDFVHHPHLKICVYRDAGSPRRIQGRFFNNSTSDWKNDGLFTTSSHDVDCGRFTTRAKTQTACTKTLSKGLWQLDDFLYDRNNTGVEGTFTGYFRVK